MWILSGKVIVALVWVFWVTVVGSVAEGTTLNPALIVPTKRQVTYLMTIVR